MDVLQTWFYALAIIFMFVFTTILILAGFVMWKIKKIVEALPSEVGNKLSGLFDNNKMQILGTVGLPVATFILTKIKRMFFKK